MATCKDISVTSEAKGATRRSLFIALIFGMWSAMAAVLAGVGSAYLLVAPKARKDEEWIDVGDLAGLTVGEPAEMIFRRNRTDGWKPVSERLTAWVVKTADKNIVAFRPQCTHLGCAYHWDQTKSGFVCPCHASLFSIDGNVVAGPAPRPLDRYELKIQGQKLLLGSLRRSQERSV